MQVIFDGGPRPEPLNKDRNPLYFFKIMPTFLMQANPIYYKDTRRIQYDIISSNPILQSDPGRVCNGTIHLHCGGERRESSGGIVGSRRGKIFADNSNHA